MKNSLVALTISLSSLHAASIVLVTNDAASNASFISFLEDGGNNTVTSGEYNNIHLNSTLLAELNASDLVVVSRLTDSGTYNGSVEEKTAWAAITTNLWLGSAYLSESDKWAWSTNPDPTLDYALDLSPPSMSAAAHPIYSGVTALAGGFAYAGAPKYSIVQSGSVDVMGGSSTLVAGGTTIGVRNSVANQHVIIGEFTAGAMTGDGDIFGGNRLFFAIPEDFNGVHPNALPMYANALDYILTVPEPSSSLLLCTASFGLIVRRRR